MQSCAREVCLFLARVTGSIHGDMVVSASAGQCGCVQVSVGNFFGTAHCPVKAFVPLVLRCCCCCLQVTKDKDGAVRGQDFEKAGQLRDREMELKAKISAIIAGAKETSKAEAESVEGGGPQVRDGGCCVSCSLVYPCGLY